MVEIKLKVKDPVCGMEIDPQSAVATRDVNGTTYYFCSDACVETFDAAPPKQRNRGAEEQGSRVDLTSAPPHLRTSAQHAVPSVTTGVPDEVAGPVRVELPIAGLDCATCVQTIERALGAVDGVQAAHVNFALGKAHVVYDQDRTSLPDLVSTVKQAGYDVGSAEMRVQIEGLHCASCVQFIEEALRQTPGVLEATVSPGTDTARITYVPKQVDFAAVQAAIASTGYQTVKRVEEAESVDEETAAHQREYKSLMRKFWFAAIVSVPVMLVAYPEIPRLYLPNLFVAQASETLIRWLFALSAIVTLPVMAYSGRQFFTGGWAAFKHHSADMNTLIALGTSKIIVNCE